VDFSSSDGLVHTYIDDMRIPFGLFLTGLFLAFNVADAAPKPLRALLITGGCCHDYGKQKNIISEGVSARANVVFDVMHEGGTAGDHQVKIYRQKDWAKDYDVIVHNECFGKVLDVDFINQIAAAHLAGVPGVVIHCAMHSYRRADTDDWRKVLGVTSMRHQQKGSVDVKPLKTNHPIMTGFPEVWKGCTPLAEAYGSRTMRNHTCVWINEFEKCRIFGTTLGHHNETMEDPVYLNMLTRGLLWSCNKLKADGSPKAGFGARK